MSYIILAINPGSTSTKIAVYEDTQPVLSLAINHSAAEIAAFATIGDQFEWRKDLVLESLRKRGFDIGTLSAVIGRGGLVHPVEGGVYEVNDALHDDLLHARRQHASNLGGLIAQEIAAEVGVKAYIADPVVVHAFRDCPSCRANRSSTPSTRRPSHAGTPAKRVGNTKS